jgi:hypothetical protein
MGLFDDIVGGMVPLRADGMTSDQMRDAIRRAASYEAKRTPGHLEDSNNWFIPESHSQAQGGGSAYTYNAPAPTPEPPKAKPRAPRVFMLRPVELPPMVAEARGIVEDVALAMNSQTKRLGPVAKKMEGVVWDKFAVSCLLN